MYKDKFKDATFPLIVVKDSQEATELLLVDKDDSVSPINKQSPSFMTILQSAAKELAVKDLLETMFEGDESFHHFETPSIEGLLQQIAPALKLYVAEIPQDLSPDIQAELRTNIKSDLAASFFDALLEIFISDLVLLSEELVITNIAFEGEFSVIPRLVKVVAIEFAKHDITAHFEDTAE
jgi:hypothetical protein